MARVMMEVQIVGRVGWHPAAEVIGYAGGDESFDSAADAEGFMGSLRAHAAYDPEQRAIVDSIAEYRLIPV